jgi:hypothetical protein
MKKLITENWERKYTGELRVRKILSILPFIIVNGEDSDFHWTGKWFKYVTIQEQKVKDRYLEFDDGWNYQHYWGKWDINWVFTKIIEDEKIS